MDYFNLKDKVAIVTGGSRGLGKAMAMGLAECGANIVIANIVEQESLNTVEEIKKLGVNAISVETDVSKKEDVENLVQKTLETFGKIDILVNNAGVLRTGLPEETDEDTWNLVINVNLKGQFLCAQAVGREMIKKGRGKIINISSIAGKSAFSQGLCYNISKAGVIMLTKSLAFDWGKHNIQVNTIAPGIFKTAMTEAMLESEAMQQTIKNFVPLQRYAEPNELVTTVLYLASDASNYITGETITVDGGWSCHL
jgi:NAD(P)-dependent dehydrogenase (short-subunit alcohol dehydrogenase family)